MVPPKSDKQPEKNMVTVLADALFGCPVRKIPNLIPGLLAVVLLVLIAAGVANGINTIMGFSGLVSNILVAIVLGMLIRNLLPIPALLTPGINFCMKKLLRLGIIILGIRLSLFEVLKIGGWGIPIVLICIMVGIVFTLLISRLLNVSSRLATLIAVGTSICGVSAIVATAPAIKATDEEVSYAVTIIAIFGLSVMALYPFLAYEFFSGNTIMTGLFLGTSIHDTSQVAAAGLIYDQTFAVTTTPSALDVATITKMVRNVMMAAVIPVMSFVYVRHSGLYRQQTGSRFKYFLSLFPLFIIGFLLMALIRTIGDGGLDAGTGAFGLWNSSQWKNSLGALNTISGYVLAAAVAGIGLSTSFKTMRGLGFKPLVIGLIAAVTVSLFSFIMVFFLGRFVNI